MNSALALLPSGWVFSDPFAVRFQSWEAGACIPCIYLVRQWLPLLAVQCTGCRNSLYTVIFQGRLEAAVPAAPAGLAAEKGQRWEGGDP